MYLIPKLTSLLVKLIGLFDVNEGICNNVILKQERNSNIQIDCSPKDLKTNELPLNTFRNLCRLIPEWMLQVPCVDELNGEIR